MEIVTGASVNEGWAGEERKITLSEGAVQPPDPTKPTLPLRNRVEQIRVEVRRYTSGVERCIESKRSMALVASAESILPAPAKKYCVSSSCTKVGAAGSIEW